ncbi:MAG: hypothetical protein EBR88_07890 [Betaproteobacteria bacterium]|nr:hypothetical protein [Betaproteobacteria bacterium]
MAYFVDRNQMKVINFIPVRMAGSQHPSAQVRPSSAMGDPSDSGSLVRYSYDPPERTYPYATMTVCDAQRHLVAAGKLPRSGVDGQWGNQSKEALWQFVRTMPLAAARAVYVDSQDRARIPPFGRQDYRLDGSNKIRIPQAYAMALPAKANVRCESAAAVTTGGGTPGADSGGAATPGDVPTPDQSEPSVEGKPSEQSGAEKSGISPWVWGGAAAAGLLVFVLLVSRGNKSRAQGSEG